MLDYRERKRPDWKLTVSLSAPHFRATSHGFVLFCFFCPAKAGLQQCVLEPLSLISVCFHSFDATRVEKARSIQKMRKDQKSGTSQVQGLNLTSFLSL